MWHITAEVQVGCDGEYGYRDEGETPSDDLRVEEVLVGALVGPDGGEHQAEVGGAHQHGCDEDDLYGDVVIESYA